MSETPRYWSSIGATWLPKGGAYAVANIRGGGEFGPAWHEAAMKRNRQKSYDDFIAVAEDMVARGFICAMPISGLWPWQPCSSSFERRCSETPLRLDPI